MIRKFLKARTSYDVMPLSFRLIVFDTTLLVKRSLSVLTQNGEHCGRFQLSIWSSTHKYQGIVSAPLWDSKTSSFAGLLTTSDYINVIQYYWQHPEALSRMDQFRLSSLPGMWVGKRTSRLHGGLSDDQKSKKQLASYQSKPSPSILPNLSTKPVAACWILGHVVYL